MKVTTIEIAWHGKESVYSVDVQPQISNQPQRIATGGLDGNVRIWQLVNKNNSKFLSNINRHEKAVNIVRFSNTGIYLATAGDDAVMYIWTLSDTNEVVPIFCEENDNKETWINHKHFRGHLEDVIDLGWSSDDSLIITGSVDQTAILWDVEKGQKLKIFHEAKHFVNGVALDPLSHYGVTMSSDRAMRIYNLRKKRIVATVTRMKCLNTSSSTCISTNNKENKSDEKLKRMFHDETVVRRRLKFTCDGKILVVPAGCVHHSNEVDKKSPKTANAVFLFSRHDFSKPFAFLSGLKEPPCIISMCPVLFKNRNKESSQTSNFLLDYRYVFAVASSSTIILYDTENPTPFGYVSNIHYSSLTDLAWSSDASFLMVSSRDGFCSIVEFENGEIGIPYKKDDSVSSSVVEKNVKESVKKRTENSSGSDCEDMEVDDSVQHKEFSAIQKGLNSKAAVQQKTTETTTRCKPIPVKTSTKPPKRAKLISVPK